MTDRAVKMERPMGFEPISLAWQTRAQPLYQGRKIVAGLTGFEPVVDGSKPPALPTWLQTYIWGD